jgi:hypothetical protein
MSIIILQSKIIYGVPWIRARRVHYREYLALSNVAGRRYSKSLPIMLVNERELSIQSRNLLKIL